MIKITVSGDRYYPKSITFPGGEINIQLPKNLPHSVSGFSVTARIKNANDIMELLLAKDALDRKYPDAQCDLVIPYVPYARQDRVCNNGEALSIKVMSGLINSMNFTKVTTADNHSDVATALINNCRNLSPEIIMQHSDDIVSLLKKTKIVLCAPDAGAAKKVQSVSQAFGGVDIAHASKIRDTKTGEITGTHVDWGDFNGQSVLVVDDICDGGMTFIKLADELKEHNAGQLFLYVTHGIFSKGTEVLSAYTRIYASDSYASVEDNLERVHIIKI